MNTPINECSRAGSEPDECELISDACPFQVGDVSNDGMINAADVLQFYAVILGLNQCGCM